MVLTRGRGSDIIPIVRPHIEARKFADGSTRVVFLYSKKPEFAAAARAIKIRGAMQFGRNPIQGRYDYKAFYADIRKFDAETYGLYAMLVRDFYGSDQPSLEKFNSLFPGLDHAAVPSLIHNPNAYMEAHRPIVEALIAKYRDSTSPLEFYGSRHMAEGVALLMDCLRHKEIKGGILADEQGMAKTVQAIVATLEVGKKKIMVVSPKTARATSWPDELRKVSRKLTFGLGKTVRPGTLNVQFELFTWDDLRRMPGMAEIFDLESAERENGKLTAIGTERLAALRASVAEWASKFDLLIADEAHYAKHAESQRSTALRNLAEPIPGVILMTGTPVTKRPKDALHLLQLIHHPLAKKPAQFLARYSPDPVGYAAAQTVTRQRLDELHALLRDCYIRREKSQTGLPPKTRYVKKIELPQEKLDNIEKNWKAYCEEIDPKTGRPRRERMEDPKYPVKLVRTMKVREWLALEKVEALCEWADVLIEAGDKVVIMTQFNHSFDAYMAKYRKIAVGINGEVSTENRTKYKDMFQTDPRIRVFVGNIQAAGVSITLTAAAYLGFNDLAWLPTDMLQAEDRIDRGGQTRPTSIYFFLANHEADEDGFEDFISSKEVVQRVTNRRDAEGNIKDAAWQGELEGTAAADIRLNQQELGGDFDWEDAGEEPPFDEHMPTKQDRARDFVERTIRSRQAEIARKKGDLFGGGARQDRQSAMTVLKSALPAGRAGDSIIYEELSRLDKYLSGWSQDFARSIRAWLDQRKQLSAKQRSKAMEIIARNRRYLPRSQ
jgi:SNF2 domain-containing protein/helicase-like protein